MLVVEQVAFGVSEIGTVLCEQRMGFLPGPFMGECIQCQGLLMPQAFRVRTEVGAFAFPDFFRLSMLEECSKALGWRLPCFRHKRNFMPLRWQGTCILLRKHLLSFNL